MRAVVMREPGRPVAVETVTLAPPREGEVLVRVAAAGVCHSDVHYVDGVLGGRRWPAVLGHEGAGVVEAVGVGVTELAPGDHVCFCLVPSCGHCHQCRAGRTTLCEPAAEHSLAGALMDGSTRLSGQDGETLQHAFTVACFAERAVVAQAGAIRIPPAIPLWQAALLGCGVVTGLGAVDHAGVGLGSAVAVIGCGGVGLQVVAGARLAGAARIIAVDRDADKLARALRRGATHTIDASAADAVAEVRALGRVDVCFEVIGTAGTIRQAFKMIRPGGTAVVVGVAARGVDVALPALDFLSEKTIMGCYYGSRDPHEALPAYAQLVLDGRLELEDVISHVISLDQVEEALERLRRGVGARSVVVVDEQLSGRDI